MIEDLQKYIQILKKERDIVEIRAEVNPYLEAAEIHRRVVAANGPALLFSNLKGSRIPVVTNLFGSEKRISLSFGSRPETIIQKLSRIPVEMVPPDLGILWKMKGTLYELTKIGVAEHRSGAVLEEIHRDPNLTSYPFLTTWKDDGGPFITLPLVYTEHPSTRIHNLGMYRIQIYDNRTTGLHTQIGKGGGFHLKAAGELGVKLPVNIHVGGPPALILSAIAPLPENVPELLLASLILGKKIDVTRNPFGGPPVIANTELCLVGYSDPNERRKEGPFGDHYGYYSLVHDYPVFHCTGLVRKKNPVIPATVVGKPRQEDFYLGDYLQRLLAPMFPIVMPSVRDIWSYGETGYHSLSAIVVKQRYKREALSSSFRVLGEGQLSLTKFLLVLDKEMDLKNFRAVLEYVLERSDFRTDLYIFSNLAMDSLDYTGPKIEEGSKGLLLGVGEKIRNLPSTFSNELPSGIREAIPFCRGCLVVSGDTFISQPSLAHQVSSFQAFSEWPLVVLVDDAKKATRSVVNFLWTTFTRFEPAADIYARNVSLERLHPSFQYPIVIDARKKPGLPDELFCDEETAAVVSNRWKEYFPNGMEMGNSDSGHLD